MAVFNPVPVRQKQRVFGTLIVERLQAAQELQQLGVVLKKSSLERVRSGDIEPQKLNDLVTNPFEQQVLQHLEMLTKNPLTVAKKVGGLY